MPQAILVTGASGYIGVRLVPRLLKQGHRVQVLVRSRRRLLSRPWSNHVEIAVGDALKPETLSKALQGVDCAYYLIHSMAGHSGFKKLDLQAALSPHLRSRQEPGQALRESGVPVTEFRAAVIVGSGSISFEMIRHLVERLPIMVCPKWICSRIQPIAIDDLLAYLVSALNEPKSVDRTIEIGGADVITYRGLMLGYARARGLRRLLIPARSSLPVSPPTGSTG